MSELAALDDFVMAAIATVGHVDRAAIGPHTSMLEINLDSLSLAAIVAQIEAVCHVEFTGEDTLAVIEAESVGECLAAVAGIIRRSESRRATR